MSVESTPELRRALLAPAVVAIVGASNDPAKLTARPMRFLQQHGFKGTVHPVNPKRDSVLGVPAFAAVTDIPGPVDHAYILLDADAAVEAVDQCIAAGVRVVSVLADGFAEAGERGAMRQRKMVAAADAAGLCLIGPNSMGVVDTRRDFVCTTNAAFAAERLNTGRTAVISQSGSIIGTIASRGQARGLAYSTLISVGNEAQMGVGEIGQLVVDDPGIDSFILFLETLRRPQAVAAFARRANALGKPVVAYMIGRTQEGQALSVSHTGALVGSDAAAGSYLRHHGIHRVEHFEALLEAPQLLMAKPRIATRPKCVTVVTTTGGGGAMVVDQLSARGVAIRGLSSHARSALAHEGVHLGSQKLVDVTLAGARYDTMKSVLSLLLNDPDTGLIIVAIGSSAQFNPELAVRPIIDAVNEADSQAAPVAAFPLPQAEASLAMFAAEGIAAFRTVESCAESVSMLFDATAPHDVVDAVNIEPVQSLLTARRQGTLSEMEATEVLRELGVSVSDHVFIPVDGDAVVTVDAGTQARIAFPCVAKLVSGDIPHKTEVGAVVLDIENTAALDTAIADMRARAALRAPDAGIDGVLVQPMYRGIAEVILGLTVDALVGPVITIGVGGVLTEIYQDIAVRPAPLSKRTALAMIDEVKGFAVLRGYRGSPVADIEALAEAMVNFSALATAPDVAEAEINPLLVNEVGRGVVALDALVSLA